MMSLITGVVAPAAPVYAEPVPGVDTGVVDDAEPGEATDTDTGETVDDTGETAVADGKSCNEALGALGWLVCPATGKISEAVDFLYGVIEDLLVVNPVRMEDGEPIYEVWKYMRGITNIVFIIFLLVMVYSQLTGMGISNYGLKKSLPKLIIGAVLVNLSFIICSLAVDVSNIIGESLRGVFETIETGALATMNVTTAAHVSVSEMYSALAGGVGIAIGAGVIAFESGAIWMLIPAVLSAIAAVVIGLVTIALRQAVVVILIMIAPLAIVAYILPNTEKWFKQWKDLLFKMLVFYPMFSLLFGASSLAGWAIIVSAANGFWVIVGVIVQIFPLVFSWTLMKMSGTFLSSINAKLSQLTARPLAANRGWAESHREATRQKYLASRDVYTPSLRLTQFLSNRRIAREEEMNEHMEAVKLRGQAYAARSNYDRNGVPTRSGERSYEEQARKFEYQKDIQRHKNNMNKGLGTLEAVKRNATPMVRRRLDALDMANVNNSDALKMEMARSEKIDYDNAAGFHRRMEEAMNAHFDSQHVGEATYKQHEIADRVAAMARYNTAAEVMEGSALDTQYAAAFASHAYDTQNKIFQTKMNKYLELTPPTRDVEYRLSEMTKHADAVKNIDAIIAGLRILNQRGDTDLVTEQLMNVLNHGVELGTHASQAIASFLMFDVGDNDPFLKRFGKYINLETANVYNRNRRKQSVVTMDEYVTGQHMDIDDNGEEYVMYAKRPMKVLLEGTSLDKIERTAMKNLDDILKNTYTVDGELDVRKYLKKRDEIETAIGPQFISASLKYLSGSEQLKSAVSFLTGYNLEQMKDPETGKVKTDKNGDVMYDLTPRWGKGGDLEKDAEFAEKYFRRKTEQYFKDQTTAQVYGMRSDYRDPVMRHLIEALFEEYPEEREAYEQKISEIQARYGDLPADQAADKRKADVRALQLETAGKRFRGLLDRYGKLEQMYRTRRGGAANSAKDWLRDWLKLNDEPGILKYLDDKAQEAKERSKRASEQQPRNVEDGGTGDGGVMSLYSQDDRVAIHMELGRIYETETGDDEFYQKTHDKLVELLGANRLIVKLYEDFKKEVGNADKSTYMTKLEELLFDPENYDS